MLRWVERPSPAPSRLRVMAVLAPAVLALTVVLSAVAWVALRPAPQLPAAQAAPLIGRPAPELAGETLSGAHLDLADLRGHVVLVTVWAAWCAPCGQELPLLVAAQRRLGEQVRLVGIDTRDGRRQARDLLAAAGGDPARSVVDPQGLLAARWRVAGVPESIVVDTRGTVRARHLGVVTARWIDEVVGPLLSSPRPPLRRTGG
jgi:cytochrome c biogenesis protein CcmG, thiol:disulfide interchange protein DsbE